MGWGSPVVLGSIVAGVVCLVLFVVRQGKIEASGSPASESDRLE